MTAINLQIKRLDKSLPLPAYANPGDAGLDLCAAENCVILPGERALVSTGLEIAIPRGYAGFVQPRSGLALRVGLSMVNTPGLIDSDYRGEVKIVAINHDNSRPIQITRGERIAQLVVLAVPVVQIEEVDELSATQRGAGGFGSSGV